MGSFYTNVKKPIIRFLKVGIAFVTATKERENNGMIDGFFKEGDQFKTEKNLSYINSLGGLKEAKKNNIILEASALMCDSAHNLYFDLNGYRAKMLKQDCEFKAKEQDIKDIAIISRVNKPTCFLIKEIDETMEPPQILLSRRDAQKLFLENIFKSLNIGDIIQARVTHLENFGAFVDIGCGVISLIATENISISRISHAKDRFKKGQDVFVVIKEKDELNMRFNVSHKELLGTWEQNANNFSVGQTVTGIVRSVEMYGIFIELTPNLVGLCEYRDDVGIGQCATVYIKNIIKEKMKIKLAIVELFPNKEQIEPMKYYIDKTHIDYFKYTPDEYTKKTIEEYF